MTAQVVRSRDELLALARVRAVELEATRLQIDRVAGFADGFSSKILSYRGNRSAVNDSLFELFWALGLRLLVDNDPEALDAVRPHYRRRRSYNNRRLEARTRRAMTAYQSAS